MREHRVQQPKESAGRSPRQLAAIVFLAALVLAASMWAHRDSSSAVGPIQAEVVLPPASSSGDLSGFRSEAWLLPDDERLGFVEIPAGPFQMGSDPTLDGEAFDNERWMHTGGPAMVELGAYFIGRYPVTVAQFRAFVEETGHRVDPEALVGPLDHPVVMVTWPDAIAYARWLESTLRQWPDTPETLARHLDAGWTITLPTEAQWEKAARGDDGRIYPWGNEPRRDRANFQGPGTTPVGAFPCPECPYPVSDMSGNVWEWTRTPFLPGPYDRNASGEPDLNADALWVMRGGSFGDPPANVRAAIRGGADPGASRPFIGFRLVLTEP